MKRRYILIGVFSILLISIIACGSTGVEVSTPAGNQPGNQSVPTSQTGSLPTATVPVGTSRSNPAPVGSIVHVDDMDFIVTGVIRPANSDVSNGNMFNETPVAGKEYMLVTLNVTCTLSSDKQCTFSTYNLKVLGSDGILADKAFVAGVPGLIEDSTFYGGASVTGNMPFLVTQGDTSILLVYQPIFGDSFYLALP